MAKDDFEKVTIRLTRGAPDKLALYYPTVGYNKVIRTLVDNFIKGIEEKSSRTINPVDIGNALEDMQDDD